jgi:hypothetical protein
MSKAETYLQEHLADRREQYTARLGMLCRKRFEHERAIKDIDEDIRTIEAARAECNRALGDWDAQTTAVQAEQEQAKQEQLKTDEAERLAKIETSQQANKKGRKQNA